MRKMVSLPPEVLDMGLERAKQFRLPFSQYIASLIEQDYRSGQRTIMIVAEETPQYRKFLAKHPPPEQPSQPHQEES